MAKKLVSNFLWKWFPIFCCKILLNTANLFSTFPQIVHLELYLSWTKKPGIFFAQSFPLLLSLYILFKQSSFCSVALIHERSALITYQIAWKFTRQQWQHIDTESTQMKHLNTCVCEQQCKSYVEKSVFLDNNWYSWLYKHNFVLLETLTVCIIFPFYLHLYVEYTIL